MDEERPEKENKQAAKQKSEGPDADLTKASEVVRIIERRKEKKGSKAQRDNSKKGQRCARSPSSLSQINEEKVKKGMKLEFGQDDDIPFRTEVKGKE